jgi:hypothetical protein
MIRVVAKRFRMWAFQEFRSTQSATSSTGRIPAISFIQRKSRFRTTAAHRDLLRTRRTSPRCVRRVGLDLGGRQDAVPRVAEDRAGRQISRHGH